MTNDIINIFELVWQTRKLTQFVFQKFTVLEKKIISRHAWDVAISQEDKSGKLYKRRGMHIIPSSMFLFW